MERQMIISIGRELGSGGHEIAEKLAKIYGLPMYARDLLKHASAELNLQEDHVEALKKFDEKPKNKLFHRTEKGLSSSPEQNVAQLQFQFLKDKAASGESFVVVGRCAESILKDNEGLISFFIIADKDKAISRIAESFQLSEKDARKKIRETNKKRKKYHNSYSEHKWGKASSYDLTINSSRLGIDGTVKLLSQFIDARMGKEQ